MDKTPPTIWTANLKESPLGEIWLAASEIGLVALDLWGNADHFQKKVRQLKNGVIVFAPERLDFAVCQVAEYLEGVRWSFEAAVDWSVMSPFQEKVLRLVYAIPYGETRSYSSIASSLDKPGAVRAVGRANANNPISLVIPCHRVLGSDGRLHGFSAPGGIETKAWLLRLEGSWLI